MFDQQTHGLGIPALGFGTFELTGRSAVAAVGHALAVGYRHLDTAAMYGNEAEVGEALAASGVPRDQVWLTTKVWPDDFRDGALQRAAEASVQKLGTEPDLLLLHWPSRRVPLEETIGALNEARRRGLARQIGVSNFTTGLLEAAWSCSEAPLIVNQVEYHPYLDQRAILGALHARGMILTAYAPLAKGQVHRDPLLREIADRHGKAPGQVALRWLIQQEGVCAIPRSSQRANIEANFAVFDFALSADEMARIGGLARPDGRLVSPASVAPDWDPPPSRG
jgi:diketogulonate reductase-like aldo/keto reductase